MHKAQNFLLWCPGAAGRAGGSLPTWIHPGRDGNAQQGGPYQNGNSEEREGLQTELLILSQGLETPLTP